MGKKTDFGVNLNNILQKQVYFETQCTNKTNHNSAG